MYYEVECVQASSRSELLIEMLQRVVLPFHTQITLHRCKTDDFALHKRLPNETSLHIK